MVKGKLKQGRMSQLMISISTFVLSVARKLLLKVPKLTISDLILIILTEMKVPFAKSMNQLHAKKYRRHRDV